ncbi:hypothetical protein [uncultured Bacteroides sp.]|uniref:hypothetical protein n=1 Tax=uncultured Bacteroides sp. TaxID=162156 RepID=UPI00280BAD09|nr:hypothetical protein [uncultured Bacteroides sp.]
MTGSISNIRVSHNVFFTTHRQSGHHFKNTARAIVKIRRDHGISITVFTTEPIPQVYPIFHPIAVHGH